MMKNSKMKYRGKGNYDWPKLFFELVVIFFGVTAGFVANDYQIEKQERLQAGRYLNGFADDVKANITELIVAVESDSVWLANAKPALLALQRGDINIDY